MSLSMPYPAQLEFHGDRHIGRWRPLVQWLLAIPQLMIAGALETLRNVLTVVSFFTVLFTKRIPRPLFDVMAMTFRYEWRAASYALSYTRTTRRSTSSRRLRMMAWNPTPPSASPTRRSSHGGSRSTSG